MTSFVLYKLNFLPALYVALSDEHIRHGSSRLVRHSSTGRGYADSVSNVKLNHGSFPEIQFILLRWKLIRRVQFYIEIYISMTIIRFIDRNHAILFLIFTIQ